MANEGSTKPTYSELEAENLRVRGLLQRQSEVLQRVASWDFDFYGDCVAEAKKLASDALSQQNGSDSSSTIEADLPYPDCEAMIRARDGNTTILAVNILRLWPREQVERFAKHLLGDVAQLGKPLAYCGQDGCRDSITEALLIGRQQSSEQKPAEAHAAAEIATEPNEIRVCGKHIVSFAGNEPCGICGKTSSENEFMAGAESADIGKLDGADEDENVLCVFCPTRSPDGSMKACLDAGKCLHPDKPVGHFALAAASSTNCTTCGKQILTASTAVASGMMPKLHEYFCTCTQAGSAETGGEKADEEA